MIKFKDNIELEHDDVYRLLHLDPGKTLVKEISHKLNIRASRYRVLSEFQLGLKSRIDSIIELGDDKKTLSRIGVEVKCNSFDLMRDEKVTDKYLQEKMCDYIFVLTITGKLALMACLKYEDTAVGVVSLDTGRVLKPPILQRISSLSDKHYRLELERRSLLPNDEFRRYYFDDNNYSII